METDSDLPDPPLKNNRCEIIKKAKIPRTNEKKLLFILLNLERKDRFMLEFIWIKVCESCALYEVHAFKELKHNCSVIKSILNFSFE